MSEPAQMLIVDHRPIESSTISCFGIAAPYRYRPTPFVYERGKTGLFSHPSRCTLSFEMWKR
ncbi:hypothetical protein X771_31090 [Mesorhizobium sp. LSJC277A00]|nr:hypothetical protein X771_31090 [Mesorhizobium sp. LSJC277A00]ESZ42943.1 hypothetical protein X732_03255 [Mesorhizobium sp. L2C066B000]